MFFPQKIFWIIFRVDASCMDQIQTIFTNTLPQTQTSRQNSFFSTVCITYVFSYGLLEINFLLRNWKNSNVNFKFMPHLHNLVQSAESMTWFWDINNPPAELQGHEIYGRCVWLSCTSNRSLLQLFMLSWFLIRLVFLWIIYICFVVY
jgi:hypothetical protein